MGEFKRENFPIPFWVYEIWLFSLVCCHRNSRGAPCGKSGEIIIPEPWQWTGMRFASLYFWGHHVIRRSLPTSQISKDAWDRQTSQTSTSNQTLWLSTFQIIIIINYYSFSLPVKKYLKIPSFDTAEHQGWSLTSKSQSLAILTWPRVRCRSTYWDPRPPPSLLIQTDSKLCCCCASWGACTLESQKGILRLWGDIPSFRASLSPSIPYPDGPGIPIWQI